MARGDAEITDQILYKRIIKFDRPITVRDLTTRLKWSRGKIDGTINRLSEKGLIAIVNISKPKGQRQRFIGSPEMDYWESFYQYYFEKNNFILIYDTLGVIKNFLEARKKRNDNITEHENTFTHSIDPEITEVLEEKSNQLKTLAQSLNVTSAQLLKKRLPYILLPDFELLMRIGAILGEEVQSENETERLVALSYIKRASAQLQNQQRGGVKN